MNRRRLPRANGVQRRRLLAKQPSYSSLYLTAGGACIVFVIVGLIFAFTGSSSGMGVNANLVTVNWNQRVSHLSDGLDLLATPTNVDMQPLKVLVVVGTRPEAIKMAPLVWALKEHGPPLGIESIVLSTKQHKDMVAAFLGLFGVAIDTEMDIPDSDHRTLPSLTANVIKAAEGVLEDLRPDVVLVQGDTTSAMALAMTAFTQRTPVGHVEAGLRTYDMEQPFPEEMNRQVISRMASIHLTPTKLSACALLAEGIPPSQVVLTGNTVIDTFKWTLSRVLGKSSVAAAAAKTPPRAAGEAAAAGSRGSQDASPPSSQDADASGAGDVSSEFRNGVHKHVEEAFGSSPGLLELLSGIQGADPEAISTAMNRFAHADGRRVVLVTVHRRENHGAPLEEICDAIVELARARPNVHFVYPVHPNPRVGETVRPRLGSVSNVHLLEPLGYDALVFLMSKSTLVLTDSGGLQEEATYLARPVLVMRRATERLEGVLAAAAELVGTRREDVVAAVNQVLDNSRGKYDTMARRTLPYGDGQASIRTVHALAAMKSRILDAKDSPGGRELHEGAIGAPGIGQPFAALKMLGCPRLLQAMAEHAHAAGSGGHVAGSSGLRNVVA